MIPSRLIHCLTDATAYLIAIIVWLLMCAAFSGLIWLALRAAEWAGWLAVI